MFLYTVAVGFTTHRPVRPDERTHTLTLWAADDADAHLFAAQWIASRPGVVMPTRTTIIQVEL
jgi:hypothetical protein